MANPKNPRSVPGGQQDAASLVAELTQPQGILSRLAPKALTQWMRGRGGVELASTGDLTQTLASRGEGNIDFDMGADGASAQLLMGSGELVARDRQAIYQKYAEMASDGLTKQAISIHVTAALGGHETQGRLVFIELAPEVKDEKLKALCTTVQAELGPLLDAALPTMGSHAVTFGDGYARPYGEVGVGLTDLVTGELVYPPLVQPYERGSTTVGYEVATGLRNKERLTIYQLARLKLPRTQFTPQPRAVEAAIRTNLKMDDVSQLTAMPAMVGGSFLEGSEDDFDHYKAAKAGLVAQRAKATVDESFWAVSLPNTPPAQQKRFMDKLAAIGERSSKFYQAMAAQGRYWFGVIRHYLPVSSEKQVTEIKSTSGQNAAPTAITVDDVMFHAKAYSGSLGIDLSMLGHSDLLSGGLGEGGFVQTSVQMAEKSRLFRMAATQTVDDLVSLHLLYKTGKVYDNSNKFWKVSFFGGLSAQQAEAAKAKSDDLGAASMLVAALAQMKDLGLSEESLVHFMKTQMRMDEAEAKLYARDMAKAAEGAGETGDGGQPNGKPFGGGE